MSNNDISDTAAKIGRDKVKDSFSKALENKKNKLDETAPELEVVEKTWSEALKIGPVFSSDFLTLKIKERVNLISDWCKVGDLGFIFAERGVGKTWLAMHLAHGLATQVDVGPWKIHKICKVLYIDGEMAAADIKARDRALGDLTKELAYFNHEILFERTGRTINLADSEFQRESLIYCVRKGYEVVFLDNLSTLAVGIDENKSIDWEAIQPWLLRLRRAGVTVVFVHHAGRNNQMRGSSKREDPAAWILRLDDPNDGEERAGAHFITRFTKWRGATRQPKTYEWSYLPQLEKEVSIEFKEASNTVIFRQHVTNGLNTCTLIADEMNVTTGCVSKWANAGEKEGWMTRKNGKYIIVET